MGVRAPHLESIKDPGDNGAIRVPHGGHLICYMTTGGADTRTMGAPRWPGQCATLNLNVDGGDAVVTISSTVNQTGNNTLTFADAGDHIKLEGVLKTGALQWRVVANDGVALSTV
jgi:hypothetical protein